MQRLRKYRQLYIVVTREEIEKNNFFVDDSKKNLYLIKKEAFFAKTNRILTIHIKIKERV
jgi:hypothetical protein